MYTFSSHKGSVTGLAYTGDGHRLFSSSADGTLCLYDALEDLYTVVRLLGGLIAKGNHLMSLYQRSSLPGQQMSG